MLKQCEITVRSHSFLSPDADAIGTGGGTYTCTANDDSFGFVFGSR